MKSGENISLVEWQTECRQVRKDALKLSKHYDNTSMKYYRVIALISADIVPSLDIEGCELASVRRYPNEGQYSPISVR